MGGLRQRLPKNYELIREIVLAGGRGTHRTAHDVYLAARVRQPQIGFATVHRGLIRLCDLHEIMRIEVAHGEAAWYEPPAPAHAHLLCEQCGALVDVDYATSERVLRSIADREGVRIAGEVLTFRGLCRTCAAA
jgi:Fe2+ or Zn2+ uptake regulation protein